MAATATAEKPRKSKQSRLEELQTALRVRERERDDLHVRIDATVQRETAAIRESLSDEPRDRAYKPGGRAIKLQSDLKQQQKQLGQLETEIRELEPLVRAEADREREARLGEIRGQLFKLGEAETLVWSQGGEVVSELLDLWDSYRSVLEERDGILQTALHSGTLTNDDGDARRELEDLTRGPITPANGSIDTFLLRLLDVCLDHDGLNCRDAGGRPADQNRRLPELLPDMRDRLKPLSVSGGTFEIR